MTRRTMGVIVAAVVAVLVLSGSAMAHVFTAGTTLSIKKSPGPPIDRGDKVVVFGKLKSAQRDCRADETVILFRKKRGPDRRLGTDQTDNEGEYRFKLRPRRSMRVYTRFSGSVQTSYGHSHTCTASRSKTIRLRVQ
jgi:hypothetical protein